MEGTIVHEYRSPLQQASPAGESKSQRIIRKKPGWAAEEWSSKPFLPAYETPGWSQEKEHSKRVQMKKSSLVQKETEMFAWRLGIKISPIHRNM